MIVESPAKNRHKSYMFPVGFNGYCVLDQLMFSVRWLRAHCLWRIESVVIDCVQSNLSSELFAGLTEWQPRTDHITVVGQSRPSRGNCNSLHIYNCFIITLMLYLPTFVVEKCIQL